MNDAKTDNVRTHFGAEKGSSFLVAGLAGERPRLQLCCLYVFEAW